MPLIDSVIELKVKGHTNDYLLVEEADGTRYRFDAGREVYVENELMQVRVTGMDKNLVLGEDDQLLGVVVSSEMAPEKILDKPIEVVETDQWDPEKQYGPTAARELFPKHAGRSFRRFTFSFTEALDEVDINEINASSDLLQQGNHAEAVEKISKAVGKYPWLVDLYHVLGVIAVTHQQTELARKYFEMGCKISEHSLPKDADSFVLDHREPANSFYQSHMHSLADTLMNLGQQEAALDMLERCYMLTPQDPAGIRVVLQKFTGEKYPLTDEKTMRLPVDPYHHFFKYNDMPIRDGYDPDSRPDYEQWLRWEDSYRRLLILLSHQGWFVMNKFKPEDVDLHISLHDMTESALARNFPEGIRMQFARTMAEGKSRHDTVHVMGDMILKSMAEAQRQQQAAQQPQEPGL